LNAASEPLKAGGGARRVALVEEGGRAKVLGPAVPPGGLVSSSIPVQIADAARLSSQQHRGLVSSRIAV
jgi:hypothetical protein